MISFRWEMLNTQYVKHTLRMVKRTLSNTKTTQSLILNFEEA